jgi:hypothetical protein
MFKNSALLYIGFLLIIALGLLHFSAEFFYLYWVYWWFDALMHFLAGLSGGLVTYWVLADSSWWSRWIGRRDWDYIMAVFLCVMMVGIAWEIFEYTNGIIQSHERYQFDVINDLILDGVGALLAGFIGTRKYFSSHV